MKYADVVQGKRAVKRVPFPLANQGCQLSSAPVAGVDGSLAALSASGDENKPPDVGLIAKTGTEETEILRGAVQYAVDNGGRPEAGDPIYELGRAAHTLFVTCVDPDDPERGRFFDSVEQILLSEHLGRDGIAYLFEAQEQWQDEVAPQILRIGPEEFWKAIEALCNEEQAFSFFVQCRPGLRLNLARSMALGLRNSLMPKSESGSNSEEFGPTTKKKPAKKRGRREVQ